MVQMVEKNLELTTQRALRAEATVAKLKEEVNILKTESVPIATYNQLLDANHCTMTAVRDKSRAAADQMNATAKNAEQAVRCVIICSVLIS
ncbi:Serologically defined colon cancer antigen 3 [Desmophyllum pertusum]|uniref:Endosome-associated-trafficking regulator 1 n=1 Tax=Desmophyllum pertusum TaxID=174260 RepID=A0A9W9ZH84_9CNID|nr:Serologically defined colon cancer antigen 3 [Desmophyllum pertusum]